MRGTARGEQVCRVTANNEQNGPRSPRHQLSQAPGWRGERWQWGRRKAKASEGWEGKPSSQMWRARGSLWPPLPISDELASALG